MATVPTTRNAILKALELGPMSTSELAEHLGISKQAVIGSIHVMRKRMTPKPIYINSWRTPFGAETNLRVPMYALGHHGDAKRPKEDRAATMKRWADKNRALVRLKASRTSGSALSAFDRIVRAVV